MPLVAVAPDRPQGRSTPPPHQAPGSPHPAARRPRRPPAQREAPQRLLYFDTVTLPPLAPTAPKGDQVFDAIHAAIMNGALPGGTPLRIRDLADQLGTSVMPVREAIRRLTALGLVETQPNRSATVKEFTPHELLDVYEVRRTLEVEAARLGTRHLTDAGTAELVEAYEALAEGSGAQDVIEYLEADERFLTVLYRAAGNPALVEMIEMLWQRCRAYKILGAEQGAASADPDVLVAFQRELLAAAREQDAERAAEVTAASIEAAIERIREGLPAT